MCKMYQGRLTPMDVWEDSKFHATEVLLGNFLVHRPVESFFNSILRFGTARVRCLLFLRCKSLGRFTLLTMGIWENLLSFTNQQTMALPRSKNRTDGRPTDDMKCKIMLDPIFDF